MVKRIIAAALSFILVLLCLASCGGSKGDDTETVTDIDTSAESVLNTDADLKKTVSFIAAGDNIIHECVYLDAASVAAATGSTRDYRFDSMYSEIEEPISCADIAFINAEGPLDTDYSPNGYPSFNAPAEAGEALINIGFDVINLANNHMLDLDRDTGMRGTIEFWKDKPVTTIGAYEGEDDYNRIRIVEKNGIKIAFLSYTYGTNGNTLNPATTDLWIPYIEDDEIERQVTEAVGMSDVVIVSMHWGEENEFQPNADQKRLAQLIADCGADVIIGHHSHTIQPIEWLTGKDGNRTLVTYSLGNLLHTQLYSDNLVGGLVKFDIVEGEDSYSIENVLFVPTVCHYTVNTAVLDSLDYYKRENVKIYFLSDYTEKLAASHGAQNWGAFSLDDLIKTVKNTIPLEFLPNSYR